MTTDKILELARRYTYPDVREDQTFEFDEEDLIAFAHALLEAERKEKAELIKDRDWLIKHIRFLERQIAETNNEHR